jgi:2-polyprenyl-3-methyl-5-hydroxy-6-metoxy-1,4-benzoquinol methylase
MAERLNDEILVELYGDYLRKHLGAGDPLGQLKWLQTPEAQEIGRMQATGLRMDRMSPADYKRAQELMGVHYGFMTNIPDQKRIMGKILQNLRNVPTLTIGCGLAPQEIFMSSQGILTSEVHATDLTNSAIKRAGEKARELNVNNITFESISGSEIDRPASADQVMMIDSLHWMKDWRMAVGKVTSPETWR